MRTKSARWGKIIRGGTREWVGWDAPFPKHMPLPILPDEIQRKWREAVESFDPLRLVQHVEALQRAIWQCAENGPGTTLVRFSLDVCVSAVARLSPGNPSDVLALRSADSDSVRDWSPKTREWHETST